MTTFDKNLAPYIRLGVLGAITISILVEVFLWIFTLGQTVLHRLWHFIVFLPVPIIVGAFAGLLTWAMGGHLRSKFAYWIGFTTMSAGYYFSIYVSEYLFQWSQTDWQYQASAIVSPLIAGILVEGALILFVVVWRTSARLLTRKIGRAHV